MIGSFLLLLMFGYDGLFLLNGLKATISFHLGEELPHTCFSAIEGNGHVALPQLYMLLFSLLG
jgi:hypothetical protein